MITKEAWKRWKTKGIVEHDDTVLEMMGDLAHAIRLFDAMGKQGDSGQCMRTDVWRALSVIADARSLRDYPRF